MKLLKTGNVYYTESNITEKDIPKNAGFWWHGMPCTRSKCNPCAVGLKAVWWTVDRSNAIKLKEYAIGSLRLEFDQQEQTLAQAIQESKATSADIDIPVPKGLAYYPFQKAGVQYCLPRQNVLIGDSMGLGKSITTIGVINADNSIKTVLIVCPATIKVNWRNELQKWLTRDFSIGIIDDNSVPDTDIVIVNYDRLKNSVLTELLSRDWDMLVCDESHYLKSGHKTRRGKAVLGVPKARGKTAEQGLVDKARRRLFLTGTPILNRPIELHPLISKLDADTFGDFWSFITKFCDAKQTRFGWDFSGASNLDELQALLRSRLMVRRLKQDVLTELPPITRQIIEVAGAEKQVKAENEAWSRNEQKIKELKDTVLLAHASGNKDAYKEAVAMLTDVIRVAFNEVSKLRHDTAVAKVPFVLEHIDDMLENVSQVVVFAHHHDVVHALAEHFKDDAVVLTGETPVKRRQEVVDIFQAGKAKVFIGSITAAGVGITLTSANNVVFAELDWVPANVSQAEARCHRIGTKYNVLVQHIVLDESLDARMAKVLVAKQNVIDQALDGDFKQEESIEPVTPDEMPKPRKYPVATVQQRRTYAVALQVLAGVCDGALKRDGVGFNSADSNIGHGLAERSLVGPLTDGECWLASRILPKYHRQVGDLLAIE